MSVLQGVIKVPVSELLLDLAAALYALTQSSLDPFIC